MPTVCGRNKLYSFALYSTLGNMQSIMAVVISFSFLICDELQSQSLPYIVKPTGINGPNALAFDTSGNLYVADYYNHSIKKVLPDGTTAGNVISLDDFDYPTSILFDKYGNSYIGCYGSTQILQ